MRQEEKKPVPWEVKDPVLPPVKSGPSQRRR
jgi:hypothetical protein